MAECIRLWDGNVENVFSIDDFIQLVDEYMGLEARRYLESYLDDADAAWAYVQSVEKECDGLHDHHREVIQSIRTHSEKLAGLISEKELDRREISNLCGAIGIITYKELNT